ncbi:MAG: FAD:protein FMN transferase [Treponema sp.]|nr:FAD:protein FMN transferase [Treponema sp.]
MFLRVLRGFLILNIILFYSCSKTEPSRTETAFGTACTITLYEHGSTGIYNEIFSKIHQIDNLMSINILSSDVSRINNNAGIEPVQVHEETFKVIERAVYYAGLSDGAFDPTVGPLVNLWGIGKGNRNIPSQNEIDKTLTLINWSNIELDPKTNSVFLTQSGMSLDLGAIAKGYAADAAAQIIKEAGIKRALINLGGDVYVLGEKPDKIPWKIGIQHPYEERNVTIGYVQLQKDKALVTSGVYERFFIRNEIRYHHIFNPSNGYPADNNLLSVTIIAQTAMNADALSTAVFVLGYEKGMELIKNIPDAEAMFVFKDRSIRTTSGVNFTLTDNTFTFKN